MANPNFNPEYSSNSVWYGTDMEECLTDHIDDMESDINSLQSSKADINHVHPEYAPISHTHSYNDLENKPVIPTVLPANGGNADTVDGKHANEFATKTSVDNIQSTLNGVVDSIIDEGTYGNLTYRRWKNGTSEAWYSEHLGTLSLNTGMAGNVWSSTDCNGRVVNFPSGLFISKPIAVGNVYSDGYTCCQVAVADATRMIYRIWSSYSITISGTTMLIYVIGRWK